MRGWSALFGLTAMAAPVAAWFRSRHKSPPPRATVGIGATPNPDRAAAEVAEGGLAFHTLETVEVHNLAYALAFGVARTDYAIHSPHREVLLAATRSIEAAAGNERYFPRMPAVLPKLLRALNSDDASRAQIVQLILKDAALAGNVIKRANSAYYGQRTAIESVHRAVAVLGSDGLRAPVAAAVLQPVFRMPAGFFEQFGPVTWDQALRAAAAAECHARIHGARDSFVAYLLGLLSGLGRVVIFRLTLDKYREANGLMPRAEVFIRAMRESAPALSILVARSWGMSEAFIDAIEAQRMERAPDRMSPLARTLYYADLAGALAVLCARGAYDESRGRELLVAQGLSADETVRVWEAASAQPS